MTTIRQFTADDLFRYNTINLDPLTETYGIEFYLQYLARWPDYFVVAESFSGDLMGYIMGKAEGSGENWHGHVTAVTCDFTYRRLGLARRLMNALEMISEKRKCYFVDLFVRVSNVVAINVYLKLGYCVYRIVLEYYSNEYLDEDAYDMRKSLSRDKDKKAMIPLEQPIHLSDLDDYYC
uniref:N-alpha-acetyltransferase 20 n=1 Tax=Caligus clemensi TaxID=344056 RepID=C1C0Y8_CALCM|nr:N-acetyltransferase 5 [Caligus clemensi]